MVASRTPMNHRLFLTTSSGDHYEINIRGANIISIFRNGSFREVPYDDLPMIVREEVLLAIINELAKD